jgi:hypothetical protein
MVCRAMSWRSRRPGGGGCFCNRPTHTFPDWHSRYHVLILACQEPSFLFHSPDTPVCSANKQEKAPIDMKGPPFTSQPGMGFAMRAYGLLIVSLALLTLTGTWDQTGMSPSCAAAATCGDCISGCDQCAGGSSDCRLLFARNPSRLEVKDWIDSGFIGNTSSPNSKFNGPYNGVDRSNELMMNQLYLTAEMGLPADEVGLGGAVRHLVWRRFLPGRFAANGW